MSGSRRIAVVLAELPGASEPFLFGDGAAMAACGHEVSFVTRERGPWRLQPSPAQREQAANVQLLPPDEGLRSPLKGARIGAWAGRAAAASVPRLRALPSSYRRQPPAADRPGRHWLRYLPLLALRPDAVHFESLDVAAEYPLVDELLGLPWLVTCHGTEINTFEARPPAVQRQVREQLRRATMVHCPSAAVARKVAGIADRIRGIAINPPGVDLAAIAEANPPGRQPPLIVTAAPLRYNCGLEYLLMALNGLRKAGLAFTGRIVGDGPLLRFLMTTIADLGLAENVELVRPSTYAEVRDQVRNADIYAVPSVAAGADRCALEAMAVGRPVVTTNAEGGMAEVVDDGVEGYVTLVRDTGALADALHSLAASPDQRAAMGTAARARVAADFTVTGESSRLAAIYDELTRP